MEYGKVKFFNVTRGWGFIAGDDGRDYFVHWRDIQQQSGFRKLDDGDRVAFDGEQTDRSLVARNIAVITESE